MCMCICIYMYIHTYVYTHVMIIIIIMLIFCIRPPFGSSRILAAARTVASKTPPLRFGISLYDHGQFSEFHVCFCGLDSGNLKFEIVRKNKQHICF